jgi:hypothetical protein
LAILLSGCVKNGEDAEFKNEAQIREEKTVQMGAPQQNETERSIPLTNQTANQTANRESFFEIERTHFSRVGKTKNAHWSRWWIT